MMTHQDLLFAKTYHDLPILTTKPKIANQETPGLRGPLYLSLACPQSIRG